MLIWAPALTFRWSWARFFHRVRIPRAAVRWCCARADGKMRKMMLGSSASVIVFGESARSDSLRCTPACVCVCVCACVCLTVLLLRPFNYIITEHTAPPVERERARARARARERERMQVHQITDENLKAGGVKLNSWRAGALQSLDATLIKHTWSN